MTDCIICGKEIVTGEAIVSRESEAGIVHAHDQCAQKLRAILDLSKRELSISGGEETIITPFLSKIDDDWILNRRDISVSMMILAYLNAQSKSCDTKSVYDWMRRNEVASSNPAEYIKELRNRGSISVLKSDKSRVVQITEKGKEELKSYATELETKIKSKL